MTNRELFARMHGGERDDCPNRERMGWDHQVTAYCEYCAGPLTVAPFDKVDA